MNEVAHSRNLVRVCTYRAREILQENRPERDTSVPSDFIGCVSREIAGGSRLSVDRRRSADLRPARVSKSDETAFQLLRLLSKVIAAKNISIELNRARRNEVYLYDA